MRWVLTLLFSFSIYAQPFRSGDILLQPLHCRVCTLIELEEGGPFSHMGMLIETKKGWMVLEAWGEVKLTPLKEFLEKTEKNGQVLLRRHQELPHFNFRDVEPYLGLKYDQEFLWDNIDEQGKEKLYCSELITKIMNKKLSTPIGTKRMQFLQPDWISYFRGLPPIGEKGNSPMDFYKNDQFWTMATYEKGLWIFL